MKSVVVGAMLLRTIYAQDTGAQLDLPTRQGTGAVPAAAAPAISDAVAPIPVPPAVEAQNSAVGAVAPVVSPMVAPLAPVLIPGINAPSETELLGPSAEIAPSLGKNSVLHTGTADVILDRPTSAAPFGAGTTPGTGISFRPNGLRPNGASAVNSLLSFASASAPAASAPVFGGRPVVPSRQGGFGAFAVDEPSPVDTPVAVDATPAVDLLPASSDVPIASPSGVLPILLDVLAAPARSVPVPVLSETPIPSPSGIASPIGSNPYIGPFDPYSIYDPNSPYYDPYAKPLGWEGNDNGIYDGEDDEECPSWCTPEYDSSPYVTITYTEYTSEAAPTPTPAYDAEAQYYPRLKKVRSILRAVRRQVFNWPSALPSPAPYSDDDDSGSYDGEDGSIPDWLYEISGASARPTATAVSKPMCPKSCYKPKHTDSGYGTAEPTFTKTHPGSYETAEAPYENENPEPTADGYYPAGNDSAVYWPTGATSIYDGYTSIPSEPTSAAYGDYTAVPEPSTLMTQYYPETTGGAWSDPGSAAGDYTGDSLDTLCPNTCNPFNPTENFCDLSTGCATTGGSKYYCACRAGFRPDNYNAKDFSKLFKVAGQPYVYVAGSTSCDTPCDDPSCSEVLERNHCK
ncbi:hypothetical protein B5807_08822 [Epicoccum nigrum]|uniref:EGF-like domain-containing protein n=1 Tax=Epicoccum nigrum TaxID=105696 RepID=A0A1Y2LS87_EPING|nr:hypothetical protein B5807_08822 [Epicoccum nigrum]